MSITPEIELEQGFPECPNCFAEIDTWAAEKKAIDQEREQIIRTLLKRKVIRRDSLGYLVFANSDTLNIEYLPELEKKETK